MTQDQVDAGIDALEAVPVMSAQMNEWGRESTTAVERSIGCPTEEARALWKDWREQNLADLASD
jgi:hypothetical protein